MSSKPVQINWEALTWTRVIMMAVITLFASIGEIGGLAYLAEVMP